VAEDWCQERVYFEVCGTELVRIQNFAYFVMVGVSCGQIDKTEQGFETEWYVTVLLLVKMTSKPTNVEVWEVYFGNVFCFVWAGTAQSV
jgi:hypothetical protein